MGGALSYKQRSAGYTRQTGAQSADLPHQHVDPFTYRLNMSALDWAKVYGRSCSFTSQDHVDGSGGCADVM